MKIIDSIHEARLIVQAGGIIAYPTEAVFGLGCDPFNSDAVERLIRLKTRESIKGLIVLISNWDQLHHLTQPISKDLMQKIHETWPGHVTWLFPKSNNVPDGLTGGRVTIAIRMSAHPLAAALCEQIPIVSTSANITGLPPAKNIEDIQAQFSSGIDAILDGSLGGALNPSEIFDAQTGQKIR